MKEAITALTLGGISALLFTVSPATKEKTVNLKPLPEIRTTQQVIEQTDLYKKVDSIEKKLDEYEQLNKTTTYQY